MNGRVGPITVSRDMRHAAWVENDGKRMRVRVDGNAGPPYMFIAPASLRLSEDGGHVAYVASRTGQLLTMMDAAVETRRWHSLLVTKAILSMPGVAVRSKLPEGIAEEAVVVDNASEFDGGDRVDIASLTFSPDGNRLAYVAYSRGRYRMFVNGIEQSGDYEDVAPTVGGPSVAFSPRDQSMAFAGYSSKRWQVNSNGTPGAWYDRVEASSVGFSPDGAHLSYVAVRGGSYFVVTDGSEGPEYALIPSNRLSYTPDGAHWGYVATRRLDNKKVVTFAVIDGNETPGIEADGGSVLKLSQDGRRYAFVIGSGDDGSRKVKGTRVVVDGSRSEERRVGKECRSRWSPYH